MKVYHVTGRGSADGIRQHGFIDNTDNYMATREYTGVWVSDSPLDVNEMGGASDICFEIEVQEKEIAEYEWIEEHKGYREWLVPARILNRCPTRELTQEQHDQILEHLYRARLVDLDAETQEKLKDLGFDPKLFRSI